jgi:hypothetical protein
LAALWDYCGQAAPAHRISAKFPDFVAFAYTRKFFLWQQIERKNAYPVRPILLD